MILVVGTSVRPVGAQNIRPRPCGPQESPSGPASKHGRNELDCLPTWHPARQYPGRVIESVVDIHVDEFVPAINSG